MIGAMSRVPHRVRRELRPIRRKVRYTTRRARTLPTFLIIGAQRAGTTSLFAYVGRHPDIEAPKRADLSVAWAKELHFFDENYWRGPDWYRAFFPLTIRKQAAELRGRPMACGEATPYYLFHPAVPERVAATIPDVRLIVLLRNPVERAYSHYQHMRKMRTEKLSFEEAIEAEPKRLAALEAELVKVQPGITKQGYRMHHHHRHRAYVSRSLYADQLERWLAHFPLEQFLVLRSEDFFVRPAETFAEVFAFLGVRPWEVPDYQARNVGSYAPIDPAFRARLEERFAEPNARLAELLERDFGWAPAAEAQAGAERRSA
jgi:Sulfotransferase domain